MTMNSDQRIKEHFEKNNLPYTSADDAIDRLLREHKQQRENNKQWMKIMRETQSKARQDANEHNKQIQMSDDYISVNALQQMTIQEIVDFLK